MALVWPMLSPQAATMTVNVCLGSRIQIVELDRVISTVKMLTNVITMFVITMLSVKTWLAAFGVLVTQASPAMAHFVKILMAVLETAMHNVDLMVTRTLNAKMLLLRILGSRVDVLLVLLMKEESVETSTSVLLVLQIALHLKPASILLGLLNVQEDLEKDVLNCRGTKSIAKDV